MSIPAAVTQWMELAQKYAALYTVHTPPVPVLSPEEILAIVWEESTGNPLAFNPHDPSWGLMGVTRLIAHAYGHFASGDNSWQTDPDKNMKCGAAYLADLKKKHLEAYPTLWMDEYNTGETAFARGVRSPGYVIAFNDHLLALKPQPADLSLQGDV
jgi:soluble lytic murein transglycosylase-like protein